MPQSRTTKTIAKRIDLSYFKRPHPLRTWRSRLTWLAGAVALVWIGYATVAARRGGRLVDRIHNPGPVAAAHAMLENDCAQCHKPKSGGGFFLSVTDDACLVCHDGAIHHSNQTLAAEPSLVSRDTMTLGLRSPTTRAAACVTCHIEHKGKEKLAAMSDAHCTVCHQNVTDATINKKPQVPNRVTLFELENHPTFGRTLTGTSGAWVDPTVVKFNHKYHLDTVAAIRDNPANCVSCHAPSAIDRRYMQPVNFELHCRSCHELKIAPEAAPVAHEDMAIVRAQIKDPGALLAQGLRALPTEEQKKLLVKTERSGRTTRTIEQTPEDWAKDKLAAVIKEARDATTQPAEPTDLMAIERHVAFGMTQSCSKCHDVKSTESPGEFKTVATGIGTSPRRWFKASVFDHDSHRNLGCKSCHLTATGGTQTSELLMPDLNKAAAGSQTCVQCHQPSQSLSVRNEPSDCVTCHVFHDRAHFERKPLISAQAQSPH